MNLRGFKEDLTIKYLNVKKILAVITFYLFLHSAVQIYEFHIFIISIKYLLLLLLLLLLALLLLLRITEKRGLLENKWFPQLVIVKTFRHLRSMTLGWLRCGDAYSKSTQKYSRISTSCTPTTNFSLLNRIKRSFPHFYS